MAGTIRKTLELIRFSHTIFALPFALLAAVLAWTVPAPAGVSTADTATPSLFRWSHLVGILICMVCARSAAMAFNRLADRDVDAANPRTNTRHLVTGELSVAAVAVFAVAMGLGFIAATLLFLPNPWPWRLSVPVLLFLLGYSWAKRFTVLSHFWLGLALMLSPVCAWIAIRGQWLDAAPADLLPAVVLGAAVLMWVAGFDIIYACQDADFDRQARLRSVPAKIGVSNALRLAAGCHALMVLLLVALPWACPQAGLGWLYGLGVAAVGGLLVYEHWLVDADDLTRVNIAFLNVNAVISTGLLCIVALDVWT